MPKSLSFKNPNEIVAALKANGREWEEGLNKDHKDRKELGPLAAIYASIGSSTFRAFRKHENNTPSAVFRAWASEELFDGALTDLRKVKSNSQYRKWARNLARACCKRWQKDLGYCLNDPKAMKLVNLLAKALCSVTPLWPNEYKRIIEHIDVPLDQYSLQPLACVSELSDLKLNRASMGSVNSLDDYDRVQNTIRDLCEKAGVPAIAYDFLMWNSPHSR